MILLDTHVLLWHAQGDRRLGVGTRKLIEAKAGTREVGFSALSIWELALLSAAQRIRLDVPCEPWRMRLLGQGLLEIPVDGEIALIAARYRTALIDAIDCMLAAAAVRIGAVFITADTRILEWNLVWCFANNLNKVPMDFVVRQGARRVRAVKLAPHAARLLERTQLVAGRGRRP